MCATRYRRMSVAVMRPRRLARTNFQRLLLSVRNGSDPLRTYAKLHEIALYGIGAAVTQGQIIVTGSAFIAVTFNAHEHTRIPTQPLRLLGEQCTPFSAQLVLIKVEKHSVTDIDDEVLH